MLSNYSIELRFRHLTMPFAFGKPIHRYSKLFVSNELKQHLRRFSFLHPTYPDLQQPSQPAQPVWHVHRFLWLCFPSIHGYLTQVAMASSEKSGHCRLLQHRSVPQPGSSPNCQGKGWWTLWQQLAANQRVVNINVLLFSRIFFSPSLGMSPRIFRGLIGPLLLILQPPALSSCLTRWNKRPGSTFSQSDQTVPWAPCLVLSQVSSPGSRYCFLVWEGGTWPRNSVGWGGGVSWEDTLYDLIHPFL